MNISLENYFNLLVTAENIVFLLFFSWNFKKKKLFWLRFIICFLCSITIGFLSQSINIPTHPVISMSLTYIIVFLTLPITSLVCFDIPFSSSLFLSVISYSFRHMIYLFWQLISYFLRDIFKVDFSSFSYWWIILAIASFAIYLPFAILLYSRIKKYPNVALPSYTIILTSFFSLIITIILNIFALSYNGIKNLPLSLPYVLNIFAFISSFLIIRMLLGNVKQSELESEIIAINELRHQEEKQYEMSKESIDLINIKCHDLRHQIRSLSKNNSTINKEELENIEKAIRIYDTKMKTENASLDIILQEKSLICGKNQIAFDCIIDGKQLNFIKESDIYSLFGNIIDNAIESCLKINNPDKRTITLKIKRIANGVFCYEENPTQSKISFKDGLPISTKGDNRYHGFGMKSILNIVNFYHGTLKIKVENERFCLSIFFPEKIN